MAISPGDAGVKTLTSEFRLGQLPLSPARSVAGVLQKPIPAVCWRRKGHTLESHQLITGAAFKDKQPFTITLVDNLEFPNSPYVHVCGQWVFGSYRVSEENPPRGRPQDPGLNSRPSEHPFRRNFTLLSTWRSIFQHELFQTVRIHFILSDCNVSF